jgi:hypothetical protein
MNARSLLSSQAAGRAWLRLPRRAVAACVALLAASLLAAALTAVPALALAPGRHYEMVSPSYKGGYGVNGIEGVAVEGEGEGDGVAFDSLGVFEGAPAAPVFNGYGVSPSLPRFGSAPGKASKADLTAIQPPFNVI